MVPFNNEAIKTDEIDKQQITNTNTNFKISELWQRKHCI